MQMAMTETRLPEWLGAYIYNICPYCGAPIVDNENLTDRYCSNPKCPEHMANKIVTLAQWFGVKDWGIVTARKAVSMHKLQYHTQIIPYWFAEKPSVYLYQVGELAMIKGHNKKWREYCDGCASMYEVLHKPSVPKDIKSKAILLTITSEMCNIKRSITGSRINIMMSGSFDRYRSRADFVKEMNDLYGDVVELVDVGKRKTGVQFLVKENHTIDHEKSAIAKSNGISIITPAGLAEGIKEIATYKKGGGTANEDNEICREILP